MIIMCLTLELGLNLTASMTLDLVHHPQAGKAHSKALVVLLATIRYLNSKIIGALYYRANGFDVGDAQSPRDTHGHETRCINSSRELGQQCKSRGFGDGDIKRSCAISTNCGVQKNDETEWSGTRSYVPRLVRLKRVERVVPRNEFWMNFSSASPPEGIFAPSPFHPVLFCSVSSYSVPSHPFAYQTIP
ncbi:hypothetical protein ACFX2B_040856 [Malus domestica]